MKHYNYYWIDDESGQVNEIHKEGALITGMLYNSERCTGRRWWRTKLAFSMIWLWLKFIR